MKKVRCSICSVLEAFHWLRMAKMLRLTEIRKHNTAKIIGNCNPRVQYQLNTQNLNKTESTSLKKHQRFLVYDTNMQAKTCNNKDLRKGWIATCDAGKHMEASRLPCFKLFYFYPSYFTKDQFQRVFPNEGWRHHHLLNLSLCLARFSPFFHNSNGCLHCSFCCQVAQCPF